MYILHWSKRFFLLHICALRAIYRLKLWKHNGLCLLNSISSLTCWNVEVISDGGFCCSDSPPTTYNYLYRYCCNGEAKYLVGCSSLCDTWLNASVSHWNESNACSFSTEVRFNTVSIDNFNGTFIFTLSSPPEVVSVTKCLCILH